VSGAAGTQVALDVTLHTTGHVIAAVQTDLTFPVDAPVAARPNGRPACKVNPAIDKPATAFIFQPVGCHVGVDCTGVRAIVVALDSVTPIADGATLFTCTLSIAADAKPGTRLLTLAALTVGGPDGSVVAGRTTTGTLTIDAAVRLPACVGDCNGDGTVTIHEVMMCIPSVIAGSVNPPQCPACDANDDGSIEVNEVVAAVNNVLNDCPSTH
jgi:hypothetical protein